MVLKELCALRGVSGNEHEVRDFLLEKVRKTADEVRVDRMGNVLALKKADRADAPTILLDAHMDEVGMIVVGVNDNGLLSYDTVGGIDSRVVVSKHVRVGEKAVPGVIGAKAIHLQTAAERETVLGHSDLYIDIGAKDKAQAEELVQPGDYVSFDSDYVEFGDGYVKARALDDRVGCMTLLRILENRYDVNVVCAFTCQEEIGLNGALAARFGVECDAAVVMEGTSANDLGCVEDHQKVCSLKKGVAVSFMDNSALHDRQLFARMLEIGREEGIPCQVKNRVAGGNDAGPIRSSREAVATVVLSVPCRNIHSPSSVAAFEDMDAQYALTDAFLRQAANCPTHRS